MTQHPHDHRWPMKLGTIQVWLAVILIETSLVVGYFVFTSSYPADGIRYLIYPFVWINASLWVVVRSESTPRTRRQHRLFATLASIYFIGMLYIPGKLAVGAVGAPIDFRIEMYAPGWGPLVAITSPWLYVLLVPFEVVGYAALAYLVYLNLLDLTSGVLSGIFGIVTCVGCTVPVFVPLLGILGGPTASLTTTAYGWSYDLGTLFFILTLGLLYWSHRRNH